MEGPVHSFSPRNLSKYYLSDRTEEGHQLQNSNNINSLEKYAQQNSLAEGHSRWQDRALVMWFGMLIPRQ